MEEIVEGSTGMPTFSSKDQLKNTRRGVSLCFTHAVFLLHAISWHWIRCSTRWSRNCKISGPAYWLLTQQESRRRTLTETPHLKKEGKKEGKRLYMYLYLKEQTNHKIAWSLLFLVEFMQLQLFVFNVDFHAPHCHGNRLHVLGAFRFFAVFCN